MKCQAKGHIASECPTKTVLTSRQYEEIVEEEGLYEFIPEEMNEEEEEEYAFAEDESRILGVVRTILQNESAPNVE